MKNTVIVGLILSMIGVSAQAQSSLGPDYYARVREGNALRDSARAQERQADSLRQIERIEHDRALHEDRAQRIFDRDRRDNYGRR